jgi:long-chain acyl-CoA synthetase
MAKAIEESRKCARYSERPWLKHYDFWVPPSITYPRQPAYRALEIGAMNYPDRPATIFFGQEMSFKELQDRAYRFATALSDFGIAKGDRVGIMLPNCPQFPISFWGILRAGAVVVCFNPTYTVREFERQARDSGVRALVILDQIASAILPAISETEIEHVMVTGVQECMPPTGASYAADRKGSLSGLESLKDVLDSAARHSRSERDVKIHSLLDLIGSTSPRYIKVDIDPEEDLAVLQYTGGTTGLSKGAMLTHFNLFANTAQAAVWRSYVRSKEGERSLLVIPLFHVYGLTVGMMIGALDGSTLILIPKYDVELVVDAFERYRPTVFPGVPTLYVSLLNHPRAAQIDFSSVKYFNSGSAPLPLDVIERFEALTGRILRQGYGLSETSPTTHTQTVLGLRKPESCGIPFPDTECKIVDVETGETEVPVGEVGELCIRGPQVMKGYWKQPEETARALRHHSEGGGPWFYTGDIARMDEDGYFYIVQRKKDLIIVSGFNVYPSEVEEVLYAHPAVMEAGVVGVSDEYRGERVKAYVALRPGMEASVEELIEHCRSQLARYKVPSEIKLLAALPKTTVGKILHRALRELDDFGGSGA